MIFSILDPNKRENRRYMKMLPKTRLEATHLAKACARKLAHQEMSKAF
jgi:hypothetical protein